MERCMTNPASVTRRGYTAVVVFFTCILLLLNWNFECSCTNQQLQATRCGLYMVMPCVIIFLLVLWTNSSLQRVCRYTCSGACVTNCHIFCCSFFRYFFKAILVSMLWAAFVFFRGDWYICCMSSRCKDRWMFTSEEYERLQVTSTTCGYLLLMSVIIGAIIMSFISWTKCCDGKTMYYQLILEEEATMRKEVLRKKAKEKLADLVTETIDGGQWEKCFNIAEELIRREASSVLNEEEEVRAAELQTLATFNPVPISHVNPSKFPGFMEA